MPPFPLRHEPFYGPIVKDCDSPVNYFDGQNEFISIAY